MAKLNLDNQCIFDPESGESVHLTFEGLVNLQRDWPQIKSEVLSGASSVRILSAKLVGPLVVAILVKSSVGRRLSFHHTVYDIIYDVKRVRCAINLRVDEFHQLDKVLNNGGSGIFQLPSTEVPGYDGAAKKRRLRPAEGTLAPHRAVCRRPIVKRHI